MTTFDWQWCDMPLALQPPVVNRHIVMWVLLPLFHYNLDRVRYTRWMKTSQRAPLLQALFSKGRLKHYARGESIGSTDDDDSIFLVVEGYTKRYMIRNDGALGVQIIYGPEDVFSLTHIFRLLLGQSLYDGPETYYYNAVCNTTLLLLPPDIFMAEVQNNPLLYRELLGESGHHLRACVHSIENMSIQTVRARVAHQLTYLFTEFGGQQQQHGTRLQLTLTHQDLADILGVTRASVSLAIGQLREKGLLLPVRSLTTPDLQALSEEAYS
jgi:CRP/FNR family cyclic AMP-dependent transcriptional regulator